MSFSSYGPLYVGIAFSALALSTSYSLWRRRTPYADLTLPPGPRRWPFIGNLFDLPQSHEWLTYRKWANNHGSDIVHYDVFGSHVVVVNSAHAAEEIFGRRAALYSDRPPLSALNSVLGFEWELAFMRFGSKWRRLRTEFHHYFQPAATVRYRGTETEAVHDLLRRLVDAPDDFMRHLKHMSGSAMMSIGYGIQVLPHNDQFLDTADKALQALALAGTPRGLILDCLPFLNYMPAWFPGASFKHERRRWRKHVVDMVERPFEQVQNAVANGTDVPSIASSILRGPEKDDEKFGNKEQLAKQLPASMHLAGIDTMVSSLASFIVSVLQHPEAQRKAQDEIDRVLSGVRLPTFDDKNKLPFVSALVKEVLRWRPAVPMGLPHRLLTDDIYDGQYIPAGATVLGNVWAVLHDEIVYPDPEKFMPERFLNPNTPEPSAAFGFGRRACPGRHMAQDIVFITIASMLAAFDIGPCEDSQECVDRYSSGIISYPLPFKCTLRPRSEAAKALILGTAAPLVDL